MAAPDKSFGLQHYLPKYNFGERKVYCILVIKDFECDIFLWETEIQKCVHLIRGILINQCRVVLR